jgi:hypothetical protein
MALLGAMLPFAQAAWVLERIAGVRVSAASVRRVSEAAGRALCAVELAEVERLERDLPDPPVGASTQLISVDGAMVPLVGGEWREAKTAVIGVVTRAADGRARAERLSYCSRLGDVEHFSRRVTGECHRRGTLRAAQVAAVADGAPWCQQVFDEQVPGSIRILDFPHAVEHLAVAAQAVFGAGTEATTAWLGGQCRDLHDGDPATVLTALATLPVSTAADPTGAAVIAARELAYFTTRREQICYARFRAQGLPIGSGAVESANKLVVEARLKGAGMHWALANVDPMLALRGAICSDGWAEAWADIDRHCRQPTRARRPRQQVVPTPAVPMPRPPRPKTIVNGRPTDDHPYNRGRRAHFAALERAATKI